MSFVSIANSHNSSVFSIEKENVEDNLQRIVNSLTKGLELVYIESTDFDKIEDLFQESATLEETLKNINIMAKKLVKQIEKTKKQDKVSPSLENVSSLSKSKGENESNYKNLEKMLQKYEAEIREHIRVEQQLKIYSESLEEKIDDYKARLEKSKKQEDSAKEVAKKQKEVDRLKSEVRMLEKKLFKFKKKENCKSVCIDRVKNKSIDHVS